ncbi:uncharacterized protein T551_03473 [Pneumocystis jirovecii RU7]|uniref:Uncharacterized protein n=1 Tax=Pneumocystis jirovecii (strain RU7) TaxID=1408657 RepID=A0A0W4ZDU8_PNEJ7|nr:uncharacterized protein T551_03473 [Pneumocystis jirovecii RU7]KTW26556.1 hypothetical protein T551_03473 [Pneumocystis jirovecii RU7]
MLRGAAGERHESIRRLCEIVSDAVKASECKMHKLERMVEDLSETIQRFEARQNEWIKSQHATMKRILDAVQAESREGSPERGVRGERQGIGEIGECGGTYMKQNTRKRVLLTAEELGERDSGKTRPRKQRKYKPQRQPKRIFEIEKKSRKHMKRNFEYRWISMDIDRYITESETKNEKEVENLRVMRAMLESVRRLTEKIGEDIEITKENYENIAALETNKGAQAGGVRLLWMLRGQPSGYQAVTRHLPGNSCLGMLP